VRTLLYEMKKPKKSPPKPAKRLRVYLVLAIALIAFVAIAAVYLVFHTPFSDGNTSFQSAGALYSQSVDLANAGKYQQALEAADKALATNTSSLTPIIQANRAGILVMLSDNNDAIAAADVAIAAQGNLTTTWSIAWFNKGNALKNLGRLDEARAAYANATALDPTLKAPNI
jgi:tetratricopeptide (TPR) repeat protein